MGSMKIVHVTGAAVAVILFLVATLPCNASTTVDEPAKYNHPTPPPPPAYPSPPPVRPVVVVEGVIYCKSCKLRGYNRNMDASLSPVNATASLVCYGGEASKYRVLNLTSTSTDKNGYFMVMVYDVDMFDRHSCRVYLRSSPTPLCAAPSVPSNAKLGLTLVKEARRAPLPIGARAAYHPKIALTYAPGAAGKCPPY